MEAARRSRLKRKTIMLRWSLFACLLTAALPMPAPSSTIIMRNTLFPSAVAQRLNAKLTAIMKNDNLPSVAVGVLVPGKGSYSFASGFANVRTRLARTLDQPFRIASITKPFAATAILVLVDRGLLRKTDTIAKWYPSFPNASRITIDDLLRMRSGIPAPNDDQVLAQVYDAPLAPAPSLSAELAGYGALAHRFEPPNTRGVYTDFNYEILAGVAARVTGKDIGKLMTETVIVPLRLRSTWYPSGTEIPSPLRGYGWNATTKRFDDKTLFNPPLAGAAGALVSDVSDLLAFSRVLCIGGLLEPQTQRERMIGQPLAGSNANYGEGIATGDGVCGHSGTISGFTTDTYYFQKFDASLVISVNRLDRDNKGQTTPILALMTETIRAQLKQT
jgi:D-alanyl-D-alanine carboxypeptidase